MPTIKNIQYSTTETGGTINAIDTSDDLILIHEAAALAVTLTINFPGNPKDGQRFMISTVNGVTTLTLIAAIGSIINSLTTMVSGGVGGYMYRAASNKWYKIL